jgi:hypothetical protein
MEPVPMVSGYTFLRKLKMKSLVGKKKIGLTFITVNINITVYDVFLSFFTWKK